MFRNNRKPSSSLPRSNFSRKMYKRRKLCKLTMPALAELLCQFILNLT